MSNIFWTGYSRGERHHIIARVRETVAGYGDIVDFKFFSDISIVITIEVKERSIDTLYDDLKEQMVLDEFPRLNSESDQERVIYLNITFTRATVDLKIEVPSVPG